MIQSVEDDKSMVETLTQQLEESKNTLEQLDDYILEVMPWSDKETTAY